MGDVRCCDYPDGTLAHLPVDVVAEHAAALIDDFAADVAISFGPDGAHGHPDLVAVSAITRRATALSSTRPTRLAALRRRVVDAGLRG